MKEFLQRAWNDIKQRKNLELYLILAAIIIVFIADILGVETTNALVEIVLAALAVLLYGMIDSRHENKDRNQELSNIGQVVNSLASSNQDFLDNHWSSALTEEMEHADELWLVGISLVSTVKTNYGLLERKLKQGHTVNVMVVHPEGVGLEVAVSRNYGRKDIEQKRNDINRTLADLCELQKQGAGQLEIHTTQHPLAYGAVVIDSKSATNGRIYVENYGYRVRSDSFPTFTLRPAHGEWYEFYKQELALLWEDATEWKCDNTENTGE